jgi:hypothetical protein
MGALRSDTILHHFSIRGRTMRGIKRLRKFCWWRVTLQEQLSRVSCHFGRHGIDLLIFAWILPDQGNL